ENDSDDGDLDIYEPQVCYDENDRIYAEAVTFVNKRLVRLMDVTVEQWLGLMYGDHMKVDNKIKEGVVSKWLVRSYKKQFDEYMEIKKQCVTHGIDVDMKYDPSNVEFAEWKLKEEALKQKDIYEGSWSDATHGVIDFCSWLKGCFRNFHELDYELLNHEVRNDEKDILKERKLNDDHDISNLDNDLVRDNASYHANNKETKKIGVNCLEIPTKKPWFVKLEGNEFVNKSVIEPNKLDAIDPLESGDRKEEMKDGTDDESARRPMYNAILKKNLAKKENIEGNFVIPCNIPKSPRRVEEKIEDDIDSVAPTNTVSRLILAWGKVSSTIKRNKWDSTNGEAQYSMISVLYLEMKEVNLQMDEDDEISNFVDLHMSVLCGGWKWQELLLWWM
nr:hypothetical protein [Tanacetum cinerariifolium]